MEQGVLEHYVATTLGGAASPRLLRELAIREVTYRIFAVDDLASVIVASGSQLQHFPRAGMSDDDLELQIRGDHWLREQQTLAMLRPLEGQSEYLDYHEDTRLERMVEEGAPDDYRFLEGFMLLARQELVAMASDREGTACVIADGRERYFVSFPEAAPYRRLSYVVGRYFSIDRL